MNPETEELNPKGNGSSGSERTKAYNHPLYGERAGSKTGLHTGAGNKI